MKDVAAPADSDTRFWDKHELAAWLGVKVRYIEEKVRIRQWPAYRFGELKFSAEQRAEILALHERKALKASDIQADLITLLEAAVKLGVSRAMAYRLADDGELTRIDVSRPGARRAKVRVRAAEVEALIKRRAA